MVQWFILADDYTDNRCEIPLEKRVVCECYYVWIVSIPIPNFVVVIRRSKSVGSESNNGVSRRGDHIYRSASTSCIKIWKIWVQLNSRDLFISKRKIEISYMSALWHRIFLAYQTSNAVFDISHTNQHIYIYTKTLLGLEILDGTPFHRTWQKSLAIDIFSKAAFSRG